MHKIEHTAHHGVLAALVILGIAIFILAIWPNAHDIPYKDTEKLKIVAVATYDCRDGKSIDAVFFKDSVRLELSDLRAITLPQTVSGSGARYATPDDNFVFWNKGNGAFIQERNALTFADCIARS